MSLGKRLFQVARAELKSALSKLSRLDASDFSFENKDTRSGSEELDRAVETDSASGVPRDFPVSVCRAYANLELPIGANSDEVRAAYRRMMRRYHPDQHHEDPNKEATATELSRKLKAAHDELLEYLG